MICLSVGCSCDIGFGLPKHYLNWNNTLNWKNFDFNMTMRGAFGFDILNMPRLQYESPVMLKSKFFQFRVLFQFK